MTHDQRVTVADGWSLEVDYPGVSMTLWNGAAGATYDVSGDSLLYEFLRDLYEERTRE